jgi:hypothetical protein
MPFGSVFKASRSADPNNSAGWERSVPVRLASEASSRNGLVAQACPPTLPQAAVPRLASLIAKR